ncbi:MAG: anhydro-N-acetylmuramic acid kinase [Pseudomonadota bacterium]
MTSDPTPRSGMPVLAIGLMSGTSMDGIDAALLQTDGEGAIEPLGAMTASYDAGLRDRLRAILGSTGRTQALDAVERDLTVAHAHLVRDLLRQEGIEPTAVRVVGFHGHTVLHRPEEGRTWQIGDGPLLARQTGIDVIADLRGDDVAAGGQGAPLAPAFHAALATGLEKPVAFLNVGGVANVTWIGREAEMIAFDTGPGNALIDDWMRERLGQSADVDGKLAGQGAIDRDDFDTDAVRRLGDADGAATLTAFSAAAVGRAVEHLPAAPLRWVVCGGGRHNPTLMSFLAERLSAPVDPVETIGWDGDLIEAQAFAYLAVRSLRGLPISWPGTTGVPAPQPGGRLVPVDC